MTIGASSSQTRLIVLARFSRAAVWVMDFTWTACCPDWTEVNIGSGERSRPTVSSVAAVYDRRTLRDREASNVYLSRDSDERVNAGLRDQRESVSSKACGHQSLKLELYRECVVLSFTICLVSDLRIEECNLVMIGAWNPAIITPDWLKQQFPEIITGSEYETAYVAAPYAAIRYGIEGIFVDPSNGRLRLSPQKADRSRLELIPKLALAIYTRLLHTPIAAMGFNFAYRTSTGERFAALQFVREYDQKRFYQELGLDRMTHAQIKHSFISSKYQLNLRYDANEEPDKLSFNFHYSVSDPRRIKEALEAFNENLVVSENLQKKLTIKERSSEPNNASRTT